jgi:hypothetical protein
MLFLPPGLPAATQRSTLMYATVHRLSTFEVMLESDQVR